MTLGMIVLLLIQMMDVHGDLKFINNERMINYD